MKKLKSITIVLSMFLFLSSSALFATDDEEDGGTDPTEQTVEEECGFFCTIGEFLGDLFS